MPQHLVSVEAHHTPIAKFLRSLQLAMATDSLLLSIIQNINVTQTITRIDQMVLTATMIDDEPISAVTSHQIQSICDRLAKGVIQLV